MTATQIIWTQISTTTRAFTNAKAAMYTNDTLWFQVSIAGKRGLYKIGIMIDTNDTYYIKLVKINVKTLDVSIIAEKNDVYVQNLNVIIRDMILI